jgi:hypothetical protein
MTKQYEFLQPKPYSGLGEGFVALLATLIWFTAILVRHRLPEAGDWSQGESLTEAFSFVGRTVCKTGAVAQTRAWLSVSTVRGLSRFNRIRKSA